MKLDDVPQSMRRLMSAADKKHFGFTAEVPSIKPLKPRLRQSSKPLLNRLETQWLAVLEQRYPKVPIWKQALRWKLGNGIWYKPDFALLFEGQLICHEVKGPHSFRGGMENLKVAAGLYAAVQFWLVWKEDGGWLEQGVLD